MATITVTKLSDTVGAEVTGVDVDRLLTDDSLAGTIMDALEENGVARLPRPAPRPGVPGRVVPEAGRRST